MSEWPMAELVERVERAMAELPAPKNGQVRAVPDERTIRYYGTIGLLDKPSVMRGRTAYYGPKHVAQIVAIKRMQTEGRSLAEITALWPQLDDLSLARMSGVQFPARIRARKDFWKSLPPEAPAIPNEPIVVHAPVSASQIVAPVPASKPSPPVELRIELASGAHLLIAVPEVGIAITQADLEALRAAAAPLVNELARRRLTPNDGEETQ